MIGLAATLWNTVAEAGGRYWVGTGRSVRRWWGGFVAAEFLAARLAYPLLGTFFVALLIAGTLRFCLQPLPAWLRPVTLAVGLGVPVSLFTVMAN